MVRTIRVAPDWKTKVLMGRGCIMTVSCKNLSEVRARELGQSEAQRVKLLSMSEKERVSVQRNDLDRNRTHLSGKLQGNRQRRASRGTNGLVHMTAQFGMTKDPRAGPSAHCLGFKWPH